MRRHHDNDGHDERPPIVRSEVLLELSSIAEQQGEKERADELLESALEAAAGNPLESQRLIGALRIPTLFVLEGGYAVAEIGVNAVNVLQGFEAP